MMIYFSVICISVATWSTGVKDKLVFACWWQ